MIAFIRKIASREFRSPQRACDEERVLHDEFFECAAAFAGDVFARAHAVKEFACHVRQGAITRVSDQCTVFRIVRVLQQLLKTTEAVEDTLAFALVDRRGRVVMHAEVAACFRNPEPVRDVQAA